MAEGARLESVYTGNRIGGSNPSLSASLAFLVLTLALLLPSCFRRRYSPSKDQIAICREPGGLKNGGTGRNRTANLEFRKLLLYPIELRPRLSSD